MLHDTYDHTSETFGIDRERICYVGDDVGDLEIMKFVGLPIAVANATFEIKEIALYVTQKSGGHSAVREVCDLIIAAKK